MQKQRRKVTWLATISLVILSGCSAGGMGADASAASPQQPDYSATKQMVVDILHSAEGKTALQDVMKDPAFKQQMMVSDQEITKAVTAAVESKKTQSFLSEQAKDPKFAAALSKAVQPDMSALMKQLMKDPEYQKDMLVLLKSPDFNKNLQEIFQTPEFRGQIMQIMTEALSTPSFRMQFQDSLKQAVSESMQSAGGSGSNRSKKGSNGGGSGGSEDSSS